MKFLNSKSFQKQNLDFHHLAITSPLSKVFTFPLSSLTLFRFLFSTEAWWDKRRTFTNRHRLEDQERKRHHDGDDKFDDEMKQCDANFSDQSNDFSVWRYQNVECQKPTQVFPLCKFRRNFCKLSIVQKYFKPNDWQGSHNLQNIKVNFTFLHNLTDFFCIKLRKNLGEMFMHFLGKMIWEKNPCYKRIFFLQLSK